MQSATAIRGQPLRAHQQRSAGSSRSTLGRRSVQTTQAFFGLFSPPKAKAGPSRAQELVDQLLELTARTDGGLNASPARREEIAELAEELEGFCPRAPLRNPLLYGDYEVVYTSKPEAAGGPYRSLPGRIVFPGQRPLQSIVEPNLLVNTVEYKALGFLPGKVTQKGEIRAVSNDTFEITFANDGRRGPVTRQIQVIYLDDRVRVARSVPGDDAIGALFVFKRLVEDEEEEEEVEELEEEDEAPRKRGGFAFGTRKIKAAAQEEEEEDTPPARRSVLGTQLLGRREGLATMAERRYAEQQGSRGTGSRGTAPSGTQARKSREEVAAERAAARAAAEEERRRAREAAEEERRRQREEAAAAKAAAEEERRRQREQQEAERARQAELREKAKEQLAALQGEAAEAVEEAKEAAAAVKEAEKAASDLLRQAASARSLIDQAAAAAAAALQQVDALKGAEKEAAAEVNDARALLKQLK